MMAIVFNLLSSVACGKLFLIRNSSQARLIYLLGSRIPGTLNSSSPYFTFVHGRSPSDFSTLRGTHLHQSNPQRSHRRTLLCPAATTSSPHVVAGGATTSWKSVGTSCHHPSDRSRRLCTHGTRKSHGSEPRDHNQDEQLKILSKLAGLENSLRIHGYSTLRIGIGIIALAALGVVLFQEHIREHVADQVSTVATKSLGDQGVQMKAHALSLALLQDIFEDKNIQHQAVVFLQEVLHWPDTKVVVVSLLNQVLSDPATQQKLASVLKYVVIQSLEDASFRQSLTLNLRALLQDDSTKQGVLELVSFTLDDPQVQEKARSFLREVISCSLVKDEAIQLGSNVATVVVNDDLLQRRAGDALWAAFTYSIRPRWLGGGVSVAPPTEQDGKQDLALKEVSSGKQE